jgi:fructoselysine-6-P-deglycase FrlB-like protein
MFDYKNSKTYEDMLSTCDVLRDLKENHGQTIEEVAQKYGDQKFIVIGAGSSLEFAGMVAYHSFPELTRYPVQACDVLVDLDQNIVRYLISNSGRTEDVIWHAQGKNENPTVIITSPKGTYGIDQHGTTLSDILKEKDRDNWYQFVLESREKIDAATSSVMEQAAILQAIYDPSFLESNIPYQIADGVKQILKEDIGEEAKNTIEDAFGDYTHRENTLYITGSDASCISMEAFIKAPEILGGKISLSKGTLLRHGQEVTVDKNDVLLLLFPSYWSYGHKHLKRLEQRMEEFGGKVIYIDRELKDSIVPLSELDVPYSGYPYINLAMVWKALLEISSYLDIDPDTDKGARKVGGELLE